MQYGNFYALQVKEDTELFVIDEVGKMELYNPSFFPAVLKVLESDIPVLASIPIPKYGNDFPGGTIISNSSSLRLNCFLFFFWHTN